MKFILLCLTVLILPLSISAQSAVPHDEHEMQRFHSDPKAYIGALEDPKRDTYQKPQEVMTALGIKPGEVIGDIGAGSGYFTFRLAHHAGDKGKVYAVDVSPDMILHVNRRIRELNVSNVISVLSDPDDPLLPDHSIDRFFFSESWHHIENKTKYLALMKRMLKPAGQIVMIDFQKKDLPVGPPPQMKIAREDLIKQMESHGLRLTKEYTFLPYQYFLIFTVK